MNNFSKEIDNFGNAIRKIRSDKNMSQEKLAELTCLHRSYISDVERGIRNITIKKIFCICFALKVSPSYLLMIFEEIDGWENESQ